MSNADLVISMGVDADRLSREMKKAHGQAVQQAQQMQRRIEQVEAESLRRREARIDSFHRGVVRGFALVSVASVASFRLAGSAIDAYIERHPDASQGAQELKAAIDDLWVSIGRDISGGADGLARWIRQIDEFRIKLTDAITDAKTLVNLGAIDLGFQAMAVGVNRFLGFRNAAAEASLAAGVMGVSNGLQGNTAADAREALTEKERQALEWTQRTNASRLAMANQADLLAAGGHPGDAADIRDALELQQYQEDLNRRRKNGEIDGDQQGNLYTQKEGVIAARNQSRIDAAAEFADRQRMAEEDHRNAVANRIEDSRWQSRIEIERRTHGDEQAARLEREFQLQQQIRAVEQDRTYTAQERARIIDQYRQTYADVEAAIENQPGKQHSGMSNVLGDGLASNAAVRSVVFGGGRSPLESIGREQTSVLGKIKEVLERIEGRSGGAVFA